MRVVFQDHFSTVTIFVDWVFQRRGIGLTRDLASPLVVLEAKLSPFEELSTSMQLAAEH